MKPWSDFQKEEPVLAGIASRMFFTSRPCVGYIFIATLRKDGAPRLHPISVILAGERIYVVVPKTSPKCSELLRDGRYAVQAFPPVPNDAGEEFYLAGRAQRIEDPGICKALTDETQVNVEEGEVLFELLLERVMYTRLGKAGEGPVHQVWRAAQ